MDVSKMGKYYHTTNKQQIKSNTQAKPKQDLHNRINQLAVNCSLTLLTVVVD
jgi:hypothetical protein